MVGLEVCGQMTSLLRYEDLKGIAPALFSSRGVRRQYSSTDTIPSIVFKSETVVTNQNFDGYDSLLSLCKIVVFHVNGVNWGLSSGSETYPFIRLKQNTDPATNSEYPFIPICTKRARC